MRKNKKIVGLVLVALAFVGTASALEKSNFLAIAQTEPEYFCCGNVRLQYNDNGTFSATHIGSNAKEVMIPEYYDGIQITSISQDAFKDCKNNTFTSITIPASVTSVDAKTFVGIKDIENFNYEGDFDTFFNNIFPRLWENKATSIPTHITIDGVTYTTSSSVYDNNHVYYFKGNTVPKKNLDSSYASFGVKRTGKYFENV